MRKIVPVLVSVICLSINAWAADQEVLRINVSGLACPFCAYSVEKNLNKVPGVDNVTVDLATNLVLVVMKAEHTVDLGEIKQAIINAGFTPGDVKRSVARD